MTTTISLKQTVCWTFCVPVHTWEEVLTRWSSSRAMCCVPSRSSSWSPSSVSPSASAWCRSPPHAALPIRRSCRPSGSRVSAQKHREHKHQGNSEWALSANVARTCRTMESPTITASHSVSRRRAKRLRVEISKTGGVRGREVLAINNWLDWAQTQKMCQQ